MIFFMRLKFSSHLKAAQFYGISLTIRSILISVISAVKRNWRLALEADLKSKGQHFLDPHTAVYEYETFCKCSIAVGILGAFIAGILIFGAFKKSRVAIFVWIILAPIDILGLFAIMIMWAITKVWIMVFLCLFGIVETVRAIYVAHKAREEITNEKTNENGSNLGREDIDVNNVA